MEPWISETFPPVTLLIMLLRPGELLKNASLPWGMENSEKLWNKLLPAVVPPVILKMLPWDSTWVLRLESGVTWAIAVLELSGIPTIKVRQQASEGSFMEVAKASVPIGYPTFTGT